MRISATWWQLGARLLVALLIGAAVGLPFHAIWVGIALVLAVALCLQFSYLMRMRRWVAAERLADAPDLPEPWDAVVVRVGRLYRRKQFHKQRLLRLLRELRRSTAAMPDGVVVLNPHTEILWFNRTAARLLGLRGKSDVGLRIDNLVRQPEFVQYLRSGEFALPITVRSTADVEQHLSLQMVPYGADQRLLLVRDVTREARLEAMRRDFVANASHELRSPLTVIAGYLETLAQDPGVDPVIAGPLQEMQRQAQRMSRIVHDLLELSRLESSDREAPERPVDVAALMAQLRQDVMARPSHPATVTVDAASGAWLLGEELQIHSAFANLVDNAAKYTPPEGQVHIRWWSDPDGGHFAVSDTGIGIAREHLPRLTERFYRVDPGRSRSTGGSGLGLAIVKHVLQRHGGWLAIESVEGRGSHFVCHFPPERLAWSTDAHGGAPGDAGSEVRGDVAKVGGPAHESAPAVTGTSAGADIGTDARGAQSPAEAEAASTH